MPKKHSIVTVVVGRFYTSYFVKKEPIHTQKGSVLFILIFPWATSLKDAGFSLVWRLIDTPVIDREIFLFHLVE
jgi:hypothetical protein